MRNYIHRPLLMHRVGGALVAPRGEASSPPTLQKCVKDLAGEGARAPAVHPWSHGDLAVVFSSSKQKPFDRLTVYDKLRILDPQEVKIPGAFDQLEAGLSVPRGISIVTRNPRD